MRAGRWLVLYVGLLNSHSLAQSGHFGQDLALTQFVWFDTARSHAYSKHVDTSDNLITLFDEQNSELINEFVYFEELPRYVFKYQS